MRQFKKIKKFILSILKENQQNGIGFWDNLNDKRKTKSGCKPNWIEPMLLNGTKPNPNPKHRYQIHNSEMSYFFIIKIKMRISFYLYIIILNSWPLPKPLYYISSVYVYHYAHYPFSNFQQQCNVESVSHLCPSFLFISSYSKHSIIFFRNFLHCFHSNSFFLLLLLPFWPASLCIHMYLAVYMF